MYVGSERLIHGISSGVLWTQKSAYTSTVFYCSCNYFSNSTKQNQPEILNSHFLTHTYLVQHVASYIYLVEKIRVLPPSRRTTSKLLLLSVAVAVPGIQVCRLWYLVFRYLRSLIRLSRRPIWRIGSHSACVWRCCCYKTRPPNKGRPRYKM